MKAFKFVRPRTCEEASKAVQAESNAILKSGGIDLLDRMKEHVDDPDTVVGLVDAEGLEAIRIEDDGAINIGAKVTLQQLADSEAVQRFLPTLAEAAGLAASPQIRNRATIAGNLAQHTRCGYYRRASFPCVQRGASECPVKQDGAVQDTAGVFDDECVSAHPSSIAPVLGSLEAQIKLRINEVSMFALFDNLWIRRDGKPASHAQLPEGAVIEAIHIPARSEKQYVGFAEIRQKAAFDWALVTCAVRYALDPDGKIGDASVWFGSIAPAPHQSVPAMRALLGQECTDKTIQAAAEASMKNAKPVPGAAYKVKLAKVALKRALEHARGRS